MSKQVEKRDFPVSQVRLIRECHANFECKLYDDALIDKYNFFIFDVMKANVAVSPKHPETLHYTGDGVFSHFECRNDHFEWSGRCHGQPFDLDLSNRRAPSPRRNNC
jgi:flavin reductase (DIM6/NTAB) family NADH-FMN oxidoreductase RutF